MSNSSYELKVDDKYDFEFNKEHIEQEDIAVIDGSTYHVLSGNQSKIAKVLCTDLANKTIEVSVDGVDYQVTIKDAYDQLVKEMGLSANVVKKLSDVKAPMPGLVLDIMVSEGDHLQEGDSIMILEAMKMENVIKASGDMTIKEILISKGDAVEKNQILINLDA